MWTYDVTEGNASQAAKQWVEMMSPAVAQPLVEWLRKTARHFEGMDEVDPIDPALLARAPGQYGYEAVCFARAVLGES